MKTVITILAFVLVGIIACDTPEPATSNPSDSTAINSNRPADTSMQQKDTTVRRDSVPNH